MASNAGGAFGGDTLDLLAEFDELCASDAPAKPAAATAKPAVTQPKDTFGGDTMDLLNEFDSLCADDVKPASAQPVQPSAASSVSNISAPPPEPAASSTPTAPAFGGDTLDLLNEFDSLCGDDGKAASAQPVQPSVASSVSDISAPPPQPAPAAPAMSAGPATPVAPVAPATPTVNVAPATSTTSVMEEKLSLEQKMEQRKKLVDGETGVATTPSVTQAPSAPAAPVMSAAPATPVAPVAPATPNVNVAPATSTTSVPTTLSVAQAPPVVSGEGALDLLGAPQTTEQVNADPAPQAAFTIGFDDESPAGGGIERRESAESDDWFGLDDASANERLADLQAKETVDSNSTSNASSGKKGGVGFAWASKLQAQASKLGNAAKIGEIGSKAGKVAQTAKGAVLAEVSAIKTDLKDLGAGVREGALLTAQDTQTLVDDVKSRSSAAPSIAAPSGVAGAKSLLPFRGFLGQTTQKESAVEQPAGANESESATSAPSSAAKPRWGADALKAIGQGFSATAEVSRDIWKDVKAVKGDVERDFQIAFAPPPRTAENKTAAMTVEIPSGSAAGEKLRVQTPHGHLIELEIPQGSGPGSTITVSYEIPVSEKKDALVPDSSQPPNEGSSSSSTTEATDLLNLEQPPSDKQTSQVKGGLAQFGQEWSAVAQSIKSTGTDIKTSLGLGLPWASGASQTEQADQASTDPAAWQLPSTRANFVEMTVEEPSTPKTEAKTGQAAIPTAEAAEQVKKTWKQTQAISTGLFSKAKDLSQNLQAASNQAAAKIKSATAVQESKSGTAKKDMPPEEPIFEIGDDSDEEVTI